MVRVPGGAAFVEAMQQQTRLGGVVFSKDRWQRLLELFQEENEDEWEAVLQRLGRYDLQTDDLLALFQGEVGYALVAQPRPDREPLLVGLAWLEPGDDLSGRIFKAIQAIVEDQPDQEHPVRRIDLNLAGRDVTHLAIPHVGSDVDESDLGFGDLDENATEEEIEEFIEKQQQRIENAKQVQLDQVNLFITRIEGRLLLANTFPQSSSRVRELLDEAGQQPDYSQLTGAEEATGIFARFLEAHAGSGRGASRFGHVAGLDDALPAGRPFIEVLGDLRPVWQLAESAEDPMVPRLLNAFGIDAISVLGWRTTLDGDALRTGFFLSAPAPRTGLLALLDQPKLNPQPPDWVPASVMQFEQLSFDLGVAYTQVKDLVIAELGEQARQGFQNAELQVKVFLQVELVDFLSSLGQTHTAVTFPPKGIEAPAGPEQLLAGLSARVGMVWQLKDEALWKRLVQSIAGFPLTAGAFQVVEEQGFTGLRPLQNQLEMGLFVGQGHMVLAVGNGVAEPLLAALRNPPTGAAALRGSPLAARADALVGFEPCLSYQIGDASGTARTMRDLIVTLLDSSLQAQEQIAEEDSPVLTAAVVARLKELLPTNEALEGVLGASGGVTVVNQHGLVHRSAVELPAP